MAPKISVEFIVKGKVEASLGLSSLPAVELKSKKGRKKKIALDPEDYDMGEENERNRSNSEDELALLKKNLNEINSGSESASKSRGRGGRKKKAQDEEDVNEFPAPKNKPSRGRGAKSGKGRPGKKGKESSREEVDSVKSSSKNANSPSNLDDNLDIDDDDDEMKLEDDDDEQEEDLDDEDEDAFEGLNTLSTKNILKLTRMQQDESGANSDKNSATDISSLNIDLNKLTRRQKTQLKNQANLNIDVEEPLMELPDKKSRKKKGKDLTEDEQLKKIEIANKRKMMNQKLQEEQKKQTINKILNEAGRKQKMRKEKEEKDLQGKEHHLFRTLPEGEVGIKFVSKPNQTFLVLPEGYDVQNLLIDPTY